MCELKCEIKHGAANLNSYLFNKAKSIPDDELVEELYKDHLTHAWNRKAFDTLQCTKIVGLVDIDSLKWVNDNFNHRMGDALISEVADILLQQFPGRVFRISGDEFVIMSPSEEELRVKLGLNNQKYSFGIGTTLDKADEALAQDKISRLIYGLRTGRGQTPAWI